ncbi:MAG: hypothetical protein ABIQ48_01500 [Luteimonas sp.]
MPALRPLIATAILLLGAFAANAAGVRINGPRLSAGDTFSMRPETSVAVPGSGSLRYLKVTADSRCKPDVQCVSAGNAEVAFEWHGSDGSHDVFSLHTGKGQASHAIGQHRLSLLSLDHSTTYEVQLQLDAPL